MTSIKGGNIDLNVLQKLIIGIEWVNSVITTVVSRWGWILSSSGGLSI